jgi:hypothetical protein
LTEELKNSDQIIKTKDEKILNNKTTELEKLKKEVINLKKKNSQESFSSSSAVFENIRSRSYFDYSYN